LKMVLRTLKANAKRRLGCTTDVFPCTAQALFSACGSCCLVVRLEGVIFTLSAFASVAFASAAGSISANQLVAFLARAKREAFAYKRGCSARPEGFIFTHGQGLACLATVGIVRASCARRAIHNGRVGDTEVVSLTNVRFFADRPKFSLPKVNIKVFVKVSIPKCIPETSRWAVHRVHLLVCKRHVERSSSNFATEERADAGSIALAVGCACLFVVRE
jgi:hypothetical protein